MDCLAGRPWVLNGPQCDFDIMDDYDENNEILCIACSSIWRDVQQSQVRIRLLQNYCGSIDLLTEGMHVMEQEEATQEHGKRTSSDGSAGLTLPPRFLGDIVSALNT